MSDAAWRVAVVGAGPVGLALALHAARRLPRAHVTVYDARPAQRDLAGDARTLALALGSVQFLRALGAFAETAAAPILEVHVSQAPPSALPRLSWVTPSWPGPLGALARVQPEVRIRADELGVPQLGAVAGYGAVVMPLQRAWEQAVRAEPRRLSMRFGTPVAALKPLDAGVEVDAGVAEAFDLAVIAEGGVYGQQTRRPVAHDYGQTAWVGHAELEGGAPGLAVERFTRDGPLALLPLPANAEARAGTRRAAIVWCVRHVDDPVRGLDAAQRIAVLNTLLPPAAGRVVALSPLKDFALGLNAERTLVDGRTVRIGNAAQTLHPVAGQGLNLGLRDAHALVAALRHADGVDAALATVDWTRAGDRWGTIAVTDFLARSFTWRAPLLPALRGLGLAMLQVVPPLKSALARRMMFGAR